MVSHEHTRARPFSGTCGSASKKRAIRYLTCDEVIRICKEAVERYGGDFGLISKHNLDFIVEYVRDYEGDVFDKAAFLMFYIAFSHPFLNGNKRTAFLTAEVFLRANGWHIKCGADEALGFLLEVASGDKTIEDVKRWIREHAEKVK